LATQENTAPRHGKSTPPTQPASDHAIESLLRRERWFETLNGFYSTRTPRKREREFLGVSVEQRNFVRQHVIENFMWEADRGGNGLRETEMHAQKPLDEFGRERFAVLYARTYAKAIERAVGEYADILAQAAISRKRSRNLTQSARIQLWKEALAFADQLATSALWEKWLEAAEVPSLRGLPPIMGEPDRKRFWECVFMGRPEWLDEANRRIYLRLLLNGASATSRRTDSLRSLVAYKIIEKPASTDEQLCRELEEACEKDSRHAVPGFMQKAGCRLWADPFRERSKGQNITLIQKLHEYFSQIRREHAIARDLVSDEL